MPSSPTEPYRRHFPAYGRFSVLITICAILILLSQSGCFLKKSKSEPVQNTTSVRLVLLPFNVPAGDKELQWTALAAPILMAKTGGKSESLDLIPLWETMPYARDNAGTSRSFTPETAANVATWLSAKWSAMGEMKMTPAKNEVSMVVDFIPSRSNQVAFRYLKKDKIDSLGDGFNDAYIQFLRYLVTKPLAPSKKSDTLTSVKSLAEAIDREYGWFVEADPGKAQDVVNSLIQTDERLARFLFSPTLYPALAVKK